MKILISSCLVGESCRYNGKIFMETDERLTKLREFLNTLEGENEIIKVCPEILGGLLVPREPGEILKGKVVTKSGEDVTFEYELGAALTVSLAQKESPDLVILKERSPSCGSNKIYDGTFSEVIIAGKGKTAEALSKAGYTVFSEETIEHLKKT